MIATVAYTTISCGGETALINPGVPAATTLTFAQLEAAPLSPTVTVSGGMRAVDVLGDFDASCQMGPYPTADARVSGTTIIITMTDASAVPCTEGRASLRYTLAVPVSGAGTYDVTVVHVNDAYRVKSPDAVTQAHVFVSAPD